MKRYKFQALVTLHAASDGQPRPELGPAPLRMVLRGRSGDTGHSQLFSVLISCDTDRALGPGSPRAEVTLRVTGDDVADYLGVGSQFGLWLGGQVGEGVVTRRLFV